MQFKLRKVGTSWGVLIPKGFVDKYRSGEFIELNFAVMSAGEQEAVAQAIPIETPKDFKPEDAQTVEEVIKEDNQNITKKKTPNEILKEAKTKLEEQCLTLEDVEMPPLARREKGWKRFSFELCKKHGGYKGTCKCR